MTSLTPSISEEVLGRLSAFATKVFGLRFPPDRWSELARAVAAAALDLGVADLNEWAESIASSGASAEQLAALANHLTISETYFFRQRDAFQALENEILPARVAARRLQGRSLRIWSAGCASGEEPYSVAILIRHRFPDVRPESVSIFGTDIATHVLERAERGRYSEWSFRDTPDWLKSGYFRTRSRGRYEIVPEIRHRVRFLTLNLAAPLYPAEFGERGDFDVILCRNVLMYFSAAWQDRIIRRFVQALAPGGWLLVGPCDVTAEEALDLRLRSPRPGMFQTRAPGAAAETPAIERGSRLTLPNPTLPPPPVPQPSQPAAPVARPVEAPRNALPAAPPPLPEPPPDALARVYADRGELDAALAACDAALATNNMDSEIHHLRATVLMELNRWREAAAAFRRVLYLEPNSVMAHFSLATLEQRGGRSEEARHHLNLALHLLANHNREEAIPLGDGMTVGRLREVIERTLEESAA